MKTLSTSLILFIFSISMIAGGAKLIAQPVNDLIANAIDLSYGPIPFTQAAVDFPNATVTGDGTAGSGCTTIFAGVWYKFTATKAGVVSAVILNPNSATILFFEGPETGVTNGTQLTYVNQGNNPCSSGSQASIQTTVGTTYYIYMRNTVASSVGIDTTSIFKAPENDLVSNAIDLNQESIPYVEENIHFLMATNTDDYGQQGGCDTTSSPGIWYKFTAGADGLVPATLSTPAYESGIIFFTAQNNNAQTGADLTWVNQAGNPCGPNNQTTIQATEGTTYYVFVGSLAPYGTFAITLSGVVLNNTEHNIVDFNYFPNPVIDKLSFNSKNTIDNIKLYNHLGQQVLNQNINNSSGSVDLRNLTKGIYLAEITSGGAKTTVKILKK